MILRRRGGCCCCWTMSDLHKIRDPFWARYVAETSVGTRGFVITGSKDGGSVVVVGICPRMVHFYLYPVGKRQNCLTYAAQLTQLRKVAFR